jgi:hypothetical protein
MLKLPVIFLLLLCFQAASAQKVEVVTDTAATATDSIRIMKNGKVITVESYAKRYQPRKALLYAAVLPGMGQVYNKKYWKLPIVYGGFAVIVSIAITYNRFYQESRGQLFGTLAVPSVPPSGDFAGFTQAQLREVTDTYRRQRDYFIIIGAFWYILQMVDAHVDAHLKEFDLNPQLKVSFRPSVQNTLVGQATGMSLVFTF